MQKNPKSNFEILRMPPENTNSVLVSSGDDCVIFDAWGRADDWERVLAERGLRLGAIYSTHGHPDHISAAPDLAARFGVPWYLGRDDWDLVGWGNELLDFFEIPRLGADGVAPTDVAAAPGLILPGIDMQIIPTPGHSAGGVCFYFPKFDILLVGDTLFRDGVGRYDLPGGDANVLRASISRLYGMNFPDGTYVVHGHGPDSTIEILRQENQWFK